MRRRISELKMLFKEPLLLAAILLVAFLLFVFIVFPLWKVIEASFLQDGLWTVARYTKAMGTSYLRAPFYNSICLGLFVATFGTGIGFILAYAVTKGKIPGKGIASTISTIPIVSPPFVVALAVVLCFGNNGWVTRRLFSGDAPFSVYGLWGLVLVETLAYFPTAFLVLKGTLEAIPQTYEEASLSLGASKLTTFRRVILPLCVPGFASAFLLLFIESMADFGNPLILSGRFPVLAVQAYLHVTALYDIGGGAVLAVGLLVPSMIAYIIQKYFIGRRSYVTVTGKVVPGSGLRKSTFSRYGWLVLSIPPIVMVVLLYGSVIVGAFVKLWGVDYSFAFDNFLKSLGLGGQYIWGSVFLAALSTPVTGFLGLIIAYLVVRKRFSGRRLMEFVSLLAFAVPGTVIGIGYVMAFREPHAFMPWVLQGTAWVILALFIFRNMPVGMQAGQAGLAQIDVTLEEAARSLGAGSFNTFFRIALPLLAPAFFAGLLNSFVRAMTQVSAVIFVVSGKWNLLTVFILSLVENGELSLAAAMSIVLILIVLAALVLLKFVVHKYSTRQLVKATW